MNRLISVALTGCFLAASTGMALAATAPAAPSAANAAAAGRPDKVEAARMTHALNLLEAKGFGDFGNFRPDGKNFDATVARNGKQMTVLVDPDADQVSQRG